MDSLRLAKHTCPFRVATTSIVGGGVLWWLFILTAFTCYCVEHDSVQDSTCRRAKANRVHSGPQSTRDACVYAIPLSPLFYFRSKQQSGRLASPHLPHCSVPRHDSLISTARHVHRKRNLRPAQAQRIVENRTKPPLSTHAMRAPISSPSSLSTACMYQVQSGRSLHLHPQPSALDISKHHQPPAASGARPPARHDQKSNKRTYPIQRSLLETRHACTKPAAAHRRTASSSNPGTTSPTAAHRSRTRQDAPLTLLRKPQRLSNVVRRPHPLHKHFQSDRFSFLAFRLPFEATSFDDRHDPSSAATDTCGDARYGEPTYWEMLISAATCKLNRNVDRVQVFAGLERGLVERCLYRATSWCRVSAADCFSVDPVLVEVR
jgi:hypothetical protein